MIANYVLTAFRNLLKDKFHTLINISGLSIGISCIILAGLFVRDELAYDTQHSNVDRMYRLIRETRTEAGDRIYDVQSSGAAAVALERDFAEVETTVRTMLRTTWAKTGDKILQRNICVVDSNFLDVFDFPLVAGDKTLLGQPNTILLI